MASHRVVVDVIPLDKQHVDIQDVFFTQHAIGRFNEIHPNTGLVEVKAAFDSAVEVTSEATMRSVRLGPTGRKKLRGRQHPGYKHISLSERGGPGSRYFWTKDEKGIFVLVPSKHRFNDKYKQWSAVTVLRLDEDMIAAMHRHLDTECTTQELPAQSAIAAR